MKLNKNLLIVSAILIIFSFLVKFFDCVYEFRYFSNPSFKQFVSSDTNYKKQIIRESIITNLTMEDLSPIIGPYELAEYIKKNDNNPYIYTPSLKDRTNRIFQANFHSHTTNSDGKLSVKEMLDLAENYASSIAPTPFYIAITDHNNMQTGKDIIKILHENPQKYKNLRIALGLEVFSTMEPKKFIVKKPIDVHIVSLAINPYDEELNNVFYNRNNGMHNYSYRTFENAIVLLNRKGLVGIAHPARYIKSKNIPNYKIYITYLLHKYKYLTRRGFYFIEAYYQSYTEEKKEIIEYIKYKSKKLDINRSGSIDNHGKNFFKKN